MTIDRAKLRSRFIILLILLIWAAMFSVAMMHAQTAKPQPSEPPSTSTDLFVMVGSDIDRPGLLPRANYNIGIGPTFGFLKKDPVGDELTFGYTYENAGTHGFLHTDSGE